MGVSKVQTDANGQIGTWSPALQGANDNPVVTYATQYGEYTLLGKLCFFSVNIVSTTMTKATLTDAMRVSLPFPAAAGGEVRVQAMSGNATPVQNATGASVPSGASYVELRQVLATAVESGLTYALLTGIGVLTTSISVKISGMYRVA